LSLTNVNTLQNRCTDLVHKLGLAMPEDVSSVQPLTGGVASDIAAVDFDGRKVCIKFALSKLRVADDWHASVDRNRAEYAWLEFAGRVVPGSVPELFGLDADLNGFAMEFLKGEDIYNWKTELMQRRPRPDEAAKAGQVLGKIHAASTAPDFDAGSFQNQESFYELRLQFPESGELLRTAPRTLFRFYRTETPGTKYCSATFDHPFAGSVASADSRRCESQEHPVQRWPARFSGC
jgi:hypothetical protein